MRLRPSRAKKDDHDQRKFGKLKNAGDRPPRDGTRQNVKRGAKHKEREKQHGDRTKRIGHDFQ